MFDGLHPRITIRTRSQITAQLASGTVAQIEPSNHAGYRIEQTTYFYVTATPQEAIKILTGIKEQTLRL